MPQSPNLIGIFGGTFDPIHHGHLRLALELYQNLTLQEVRFIPCRQPVHRNPTQASASQRLDMVTLAIKNQPAFVVDDREIKRTTPSYMVDTLTSLRQELSTDNHLCLILGVDALNKFMDWHKWREILKLSHIIGVRRPDWEHERVPQALQSLLITDPCDLKKHSAGLLLLQETTSLQISASAIRQQLKQALNPRYLLPDPILQYIKSEKLYLP